MCGRYVLTASVDDIVEHFQVARGFCTTPRYNIAPNTLVPVIRAEAKQVDFMRWGFIPQWAKQEQAQRGFMNARFETIAEKPAFKSSFLRRRCLLPANGYYEWQSMRHGKQPYYISAPDERLFAFAGIWDTWTDENGVSQETCAIITMPATLSLQGIHARMPVILSQTQYSTWLDKRSLQSTLLSMLASSASQTLRVHPVSTKVNDPSFEQPECLNSL